MHHYIQHLCTFIYRQYFISINFWLIISNVLVTLLFDVTPNTVSVFGCLDTLFPLYITEVQNYRIECIITHILSIYKPFKEEPSELEGFDTANTKQMCYICSNIHLRICIYLCLHSFLHSGSLH